MIKETKHKYKGYEIIGTTYMSEGGWVLYGRYYKEGSLKRNYNIKKDGRYVINPNCIYEKLKYAKEEVDEIIAKSR